MRTILFIACASVLTMCFTCCNLKNEKTCAYKAKVDSLLASSATKPRLDVRIRDPFVMPDECTQTYFIYKSQKNSATGKDGVACYLSKDLDNWAGPFQVFEREDGFWGNKAIWAPEVHKYNGKYYLFATFTSNETPPQRMVNDGEKRMEMARRGSAILVADSPLGPFAPLKNSSHTPSAWMALDGTLYVESKIPYMIFCHEWIQISDGTMEIVQLKADLSDTIGAPKTLFKATDAPWVRSLKEIGSEWHGYITDGPFFYKTKNGKLLMIWSSFGVQKYAVGMAVSENGKIAGPWRQIEKPLFEKDGGHGMLFKTFDGKLMISLHQPNGDDLERARFFEIEEVNDLLQVKTAETK